LLAEGHHVAGTHRPEGLRSAVLDHSEIERIEWRPLELASRESVDQASRGPWDVVYHLAAVSSGTDARADPGLAWEVNAAGTARLAEALADQLRVNSDPLLVLVSTGEVYGSGSGQPRREEDPITPSSPYAASKAGAELAAQEVARRTGLRVMIARAFPHTGPGQDPRFVVPALAGRLLAARRIRAPVIKAGNLEAVRDFLDVRDATRAYTALAERGAPGGVYNVASGEGRSLDQVARRLMELIDWSVTIETDAKLVRPSDIRHLVGNATRLRALGWSPIVSFDQALRDLLDAQAH
jgi:GDP-4-dehydro-6-deoxy-D-mannose reductase